MLNPESKPTFIEEEKGGKEWSSREMACEEVCAQQLSSEFELEDILHYLKTGMAAVIEDNVTQRFQAEELKVMMDERSIIKSSFINHYCHTRCVPNRMRM